MTEPKQIPKIQKSTPIYCPDCKTKIPRDVLENNNDPNAVCCPLCGVIILIEPEIKIPEKTQEKREQPAQVEILQPPPRKNAKWYLKIHLYYSIHELLYTKITASSRIKKQKKIRTLTINRYAKQLRSKLLKSSISRNLRTRLSPREQRKLKKLLHQFKITLKDENQFKKDQIHAFMGGIQFVIDVMKGNYEFVDLSATEKELIMELKEKSNFFKDIRHKKSGARAILIILARFIHQRLFALARSNETLSHNTVKDIVDGLIDQLSDENSIEWIENQLNINLDKIDRKNFKILRNRLIFDWIQRESVSNLLVSTLDTVRALMHDTTDEVPRNGLSKIILQGFEECELFRLDKAFSTNEKLNLTIVLARLIHAQISVAFSPPKQPNPHQKLPAALQRDIANTILEGLLDNLEINRQFLLRFYNFSLDKFHAAREKLFEKLDGDMMYRASFKTFLGNLIKTVFKLTRLEPKGSKLTPLELRIREDLEVYPHDWRNANVKLFEDSKKSEDKKPTEDKYPLTSLEEISRELKTTGKFEDIFTRKIADDDPLWRARAYFLGFFYTDGSIFRLKNPVQYMVYAAQNIKDKDIIENLQKAVGGNITGPNKVGRIRLEFTNKKLYFKLKELGMVEKHNNKEGALKVNVPNLINRKINGESLLKDFVRGHLEGDGSFSGTYDNNSLRYQLLGPKQFIEILQMKMTEEKPDISSFISPVYSKYMILEDREHMFFGKNRIYIKGKGLHILTEEDLENGKIERRKHEWIVSLHIAGAYNSIKFFNWIYDNDDKFNEKKCNDITICGARKFKKALIALGNNKKRQEMLAPEWRDIIYEVIPDLKPEFYETKELMDIVNKRLKIVLISLGIGHIYEKKKVSNLASFAYRLKFFEYNDLLIGHFRKKEGRVFRNYYYSKINPPKNLPEEMFDYIDLVKKNGAVKRNIKNVIISIFLRNNMVRSFNDIIEEIAQTNSFSKGSIPKSRVKMYIMELIAFRILYYDEEDEKIELCKFRFSIKRLEEIFKSKESELKSKYEILINR